MQYKKLFQDITFQADLIQKFLLLVFISAIISYSGCSDNPVDPDIGKGFEIYFLDDPNIKVKDIIDKDINSLKLKSIPWITEKVIDFYDYSSHCIYLKEDKSKFFPEFTFFYIFPQSWSDKPFMIKIDGTPQYIGYFRGQYSNNWWSIPHMDETDIGGYPIDILHINWVFYYNKDIRSSSEIRKNINEQSIYHEGIAVILDSMEIRNNDTATVVYGITLLNNDKDNLYIFDPDKAGSGLFHFYNNGPNLLDSTKRSTFGSIYKKIIKPQPSNSWETSWFTKLESKQNIKRNIILKGYPRIPDGNYLCQFSYDGPTAIDKKNRQLPDGRYWIGFTLSNYLEIKVRNGKTKASKRIEISKYLLNSTIIKPTNGQ